MIRQFESTNYIAAKNFLYKDDLPYCYVNDLFLKLSGHKKIKLENYSSLADIHPNDQQKYNEDVKVLEWGNLLSFNGNFIFKSFVIPLDELEIIDATPPHFNAFS